MKTRFSTIDIVAVLHDLQAFVGMRVNNVYDIDSKTYLIRLMKPDSKAVILFESGCRLHSTEFDWPKALAPSSFSMKLRKHIKQKRLERIRQVGADRIVEMQFGSGEVACHVFVELYDRGNVVLTDYTLTILNVLRPRTDKDTDVKFVVKETYPIHLCRQWEEQEQFRTTEKINELFADAKVGDNLRKILNPKFQYGPALLEHCLIEAGFRRDSQFGKQIRLPDDAEKIRGVLQKAEEIFGQIRAAPCRGYVTFKVETRVADGHEVEAYEEFHPYLFLQIGTANSGTGGGSGISYKEFATFNAAVDNFFSKQESQKIDLKAIQQEKVALKKCENIRKDHEQRLRDLTSAQDVDFVKAELILAHSALVDRAILVIRSAVANQLSWEEIQELVDEGQEQGDPTASMIKKLKLETSQITLALPNNTYIMEDEDEEEGGSEEKSQPTSSGGNRKISPIVVVDIDLNSNSHQNARKYFDHKKQAAAKQQKTIDASKKALKAAEQKMHETLKQVQLKTTIMKSRKPYWFEKFLWFLSSDGYLIVGGRDAQQNELLVKRYLRPGDLYVHADIRGAASVIIKNPAAVSAEQQPAEPPPRTLQEAGTMAVCYSAAWDAKVVTSAWWVWHNQVSKTAPAGEYLTTGSFMIRGKKNFLPPCQLVMGFGILFRLDEESIPRHQEMLRQQQRLARMESSSETNTIEQREVITEELGDDGEEINVESGDSADEEEDKHERDATTTDGEKQRGDGAKDIDEAIPDEAQEEEVEFPDVEVSLRHLSSVEGQKQQQQQVSEEISVIQVGPSAPPQRKARQQSSADVATTTKKCDEKTNGGGPKRGQRNKQKKIKEKYKDQDEEEREIRMQLLGSAGGCGKAEKEKKSDKKKSKTGGGFQAAQKKANNNNRQIQGKTTLVEKGKDIFTTTTAEGQDSEAKNSEGQEGSSADQQPSVEGVHHRDDQQQDDHDQEEHAQWNVEITSAQEALTSAPLEDDVLHFGIPMCAPYSALSSHKYKVKLTPGTGKRGKATKIALTVFMKDRACTTRERELLKAMQDQDLARNLPGKVKVSAPQLAAAKKRK